MGAVANLVLFLVLFHVGVLLAEPPHCYFQAIFNFGDSNSATGTSYLSSPYGQTFFGKPSGRASDGRLIIDFMAERLGLQYLNSYSESAGNNYRQGVNFAAGGATIRPQSSNSNNIPSLNVQVGQFKEFKKQGSGRYGEDKYPQQNDFTNALYTVDIGQNDLNAGVGYIPDMINQFSQAIYQLHDAGARSFWIHNSGPVGCLPNHIAYYTSQPQNKDQSGCVNSENEVAREFNRQLKDKVTELRNNLQDSALTYVDVYTAKYNLISQAQQQGFNDPAKFCCGNYQEGGQTVRCGQGGSSTCQDPSKYVSWDAAHYTEAANKWIADRILYGGLSDTGSSIYQACFRQPYKH